ncbi:MAG: YqiA/YcfP family alpha/beta fold hydrolase [Xanthomonadales bacterium]|nr:YqiA/YcfP family alpha/beta fold hydrolase [Xanthomonadales bacterium]
MGLVVFSHGRDSSPAARKITALLPVARELGWDTLAPDYRESDDPAVRVEILRNSLPAGQREPLVLYGSSLGGLVSVFAAQTIPVQGLFLLAPAVYWPGYEHLDYACDVPVIQVVHGWRDEVVGWQQVVRWAGEHHARLELVDDDHLLSARLDELRRTFHHFLQRVADEV